MTATGSIETNNNHPPVAPPLLAHGVRSQGEHARAMGNGGEQPGGVSIYDAREARCR